MRVAIISRVFSRQGGGAESYSVALVQELAARHEIHIFAQETDQPVAGVQYHRVFCLSRKPRWINQLLFALATWWRTRRGFDVVHSHENTWHGQIQTVHVRPTRYNLFHGRRGMRLALRWLKVLLSPRLITYVRLEGARFRERPGRQVVATSDTLRDECNSAYPEATVSVVTPGVRIAPAIDPATARASLGLPPEKTILLFVANDYPRKGLDALLAALAQLPPSMVLAVAGNGTHVPRYEGIATSLGVRDRVHFLGSRADLRPVYAAADALVHPTLEDSFAMVVLEAMGHGLPVVVSGPRHCGISRHLQDRVEAWLVDDPRDADALAQAIDWALQPAMARSLGEAALRFAQGHSWEVAALQYERLYERAAQATGPH